MPPFVRRKKDNRKGIRFTILVTGCQGTGKTSFINSLLDQNILPHRFEKKADKTIPKTITFSNLSSITASELEQKFDPSLANYEPGIAITETSVEIIDDDDSKILLTIIDTPGFGDNLDNNICIQEICNFLEQQFDFVLAEETKVRRNPRFEDTRVHVCLYFIEPTGHGLKELDVQSMLKMSKYVNVIPVIGRADSFTKTELTTFKRNIIQDIERFKIPIYQFQADESETDPEIIEESNYLSSLQPFAIITSDIEATINDKKTRVRRYPWGEIDINDTSFSDFPILKSVILGSQLQDLKDITHDYLYEAYRTEKLSSVVDLKNEFTDSTYNTSNISNSSEPPSMSNLAEIANSKSMAKFDLPKRQIDDLSNNLSKSTINEEDESVSEIDGNVSKRNNSITSDLSEAQSQSTLAKPQIPHSSSVLNSPQLSMGSNKSFNSPSVNHYQVPHSQIDPKKLRKISETVPYMLKHETLRSKQTKLEELERQHAQELAKRAAELERKAQALKQRERLLQEKLRQQESLSTSVANSTDNINEIESTTAATSIIENGSITASNTNNNINASSNSLTSDASKYVDTTATEE